MNDARELSRVFDAVTKRSTNRREEKVETDTGEQNTFDDVVGAIDALEPEPERHLSIQIDNSLRDAIRAAQGSGQPAGVTIAVKVRPGPDRRITFSATVNAKLPRPPVNAATLFADADGNVHKSDPAQQRLGFYDATQTRKSEV